MPTDPTKSKLTAEYKHDAPLLTCAFDPGGRFLFAGGRDRGVVAVDLASGTKHVLAGHDTWVGAAARAGEDLVLTADQAGRVVAWECGGKVPEPRWAAEAHPAAVQGLAVAADGKAFATGDRHGTVRVWRAADGKRLHELPPAEFPVTGVAWHPDGRRLFTADRRPQKPRVRLWDVAAGKEQFTAEAAELSGYRRVEDVEWGGIRGLAASPDGKHVVACGRAGYDGPMCALVFDADTGKLQGKLSSPVKGVYYSPRFHPDGFLMTAGVDIGKGEVRVWDPRKHASLADAPTPGPCTALDVHPDGKRFAAALTTGKGSYPDAGALVVYAWTA